MKGMSAPAVQSRAGADILILRANGIEENPRRFNRVAACLP